MPKNSKKQVNISGSNIYPDLQGYSCFKYPVNSRPLINPSISWNSRKIVLLKSIHDFQDNLNSFQNQKVDANSDLEIAKTSYIKMNKTNDSNINFETLNATNNIENIISPEQIVTQVVSLARDSIDITKNVQGIDQQNINSGINTDDNGNNTASTQVIDELLSQSIRNHSSNMDRHEETKPHSRDNSKYKGSRRKDKQMKENALLEVTNNIITKKGILKKEDLDNEGTAFYLTTGFNASGVEMPMQLTDPENIFNGNIAINSVHNVTLKNGTATAYMFESKRKKNVRFNDNVVIIYYTSAECQQQAIRNGTFITSVVEPLKVALQQQQRNRELRNKHSYTHTIFPTAVRCGKS